MKVLVTGADGFVGSHLSQNEKFTVIPLKDDSGAVDIRDSKCVGQLVANAKPDAVVHLAAQSFVPTSFENPRETFDVNFNGTFALLSALQDAGFDGRMLYVSSSDVYGLVSEHDQPISELCPLKPRSPYAVSKVSAEALCYQWSQTSDFECILARPFNHIGPGQDPRFVISDFAKQLVEIKARLRVPVLKVGDIDVSRDFSDVRDIVDAYNLLIEKGSNGEVYNICSGVSRSIRSLVELMCSELGIDIEFEQDTDRMRKSEQRIVCGDPSKITHYCGWKPKITMDNSIKDILNYWEREVNE